MEHCRLREAADDLVRAGDHQVRAQRKSVRGQILVEGHVRAPRLVDNQRNAARMGDVGERAHVCDGAEIRRRDDPRSDRPRGLRQRHVQRLRRQAVRDPQLGVELRCGEGRAQAGEHERVDGAGVRVSLHDHLVAVVGQRETRRQVALRGAVAEKPCSLCPPRLRRQPLRLLEWGRLGPDVDPVGERGYVQAQRTLADRLQQLWIGARAALVPGNVQARGFACGVGAQRLQVWGLVLARAHVDQARRRRRRPPGASG
jgi:hypothetical protein